MKSLLFALLMLFSMQAAATTPVRVLVYHQVTDKEPASSTVIHPRVFEQHLRMIERLGYTTVTISEVVRHLRGEIVLPEKAVALTFDDGWVSDLWVAEHLKKRGMKATFYVLSSFEGDIYITKDQLKQLASHHNFEIGAHTHTHFMEWEKKMDEAKDSLFYGEAIMSKLLIEDIIKQPVRSFSWPFGYIRPVVQDHLERMGFTSSVGIDAVTDNTPSSTAFSIKRLNIAGTCKAEDIRHKLETGKFKECR